MKSKVSLATAFIAFHMVASIANAQVSAENIKYEPECSGVQKVFSNGASLDMPKDVSCVRSTAPSYYSGTFGRVSCILITTQCADLIKKLIDADLNIAEKKLRGVKN